jgi:N-glycosidase YbiA
VATDGNGSGVKIRATPIFAPPLKPLTLKTINSFQGEYRFLSNFWPCYLEYEKILYPTVEHAYQAAKVESPTMKALIRDCATPAEAKDWFETHDIKPGSGWTVEKKLMIMEGLLMIKFGGKEPLLTRALLATGDAELIEGNNWNDVFWGVCNGTGENNLGRLLMKIREELFRQKEQIIFRLEKNQGNAAVADALSITERCLYERMIAFGIKNNEYWI